MSPAPVTRPSDDELRAAWAWLYSRRRGTCGYEADMRDPIRAGLTLAYALAQRQRARRARRNAPSTPTRPAATAVDLKRAAAGDRDD